MATGTERKCKKIIKKVMDNIHPIFETLLSKVDKEKFLNQKSYVVWLTGLSGSGKSTIAQGLEKKLFNSGYFPQVLDGDNIRTGICNNLDFSLKGRTENVRRIAEVSKLFCNAGIICLNSFVSPTREIRKVAKDIVGKELFLEIFINTPLEICEKRDVKGLYKKARIGMIKNFTGIDSPYEAPENPDLEIKTNNKSIETSVDLLYDFLIPKVRI